MNTVSYDDFAKLDLRVAKIIATEQTYDGISKAIIKVEMIKEM